MVKVWLSSYLWLPHNQRACSFKVVQMVSRSMRTGSTRNGVWAYELLQHTSLQTSTNPFDPERGWFKTIGNITVTSNDIASRWLAPGQLIDPGLWMKVHPYCSAAICGAEAAKSWYIDYIHLLRMCLNTTTFHQIQRNKINVDYVPPPISPFGMR